MFYIYKLKCEYNNKSYIGQTTSVDKRIRKHLSGESHNRRINNDVKKHGAGKFTAEILCETEDPIMANYQEIRCIEDESSKKSYNIATGGQLIQTSQDRYICDRCNDIFSTTLGYEKAGIMLFDVVDDIVDYICLLCDGCRLDDPRTYDKKHLPRSLSLTGTALMDLVLNYKVSDCVINKCMIVDGKINSRMAYAYFTKMSGWVK